MTYFSFHTFAQEFVKSCNSGSDVVGLVLDKTPLYAEQGGQTFDKDLMVFMVSVSVVLCRFVDVVWHSFINSWGTLGCCGVPSEVYTEAPRPLYRLAACLYLFDGPELMQATVTCNGVEFTVDNAQKYASWRILVVVLPHY